MLSYLLLRNLATISDVSVEFVPGLNVLTGETGAGKSILIEGLQLVLGARADRSLVRPGASAAVIEALFTGENGDELIVRREVRTRGRSRLFVNDELSSLEEAREILAGLIDIHSQGSSPAMLDRKNQLKALDEYAGCCGPAREMSESFRTYVKYGERVAELESMLERAGERKDITSHELSLIEELRPSREDYMALLDERRRLNSARESMEAINAVSGGVSGEGGLLERVAYLKSLVKNAGSDAESVYELLEQAEIALSEAGNTCAGLLAGMENAPWRLEEVDERLDAYSRLMGRSGGSLDALLGMKEALVAELARYESMEMELKELRGGIPELEARVLEIGKKLLDRRTSAAGRLQEEVQRELRLLGMPDAIFRVELSPPRHAGVREVGGMVTGAEGPVVPMFVFSANPGMEPGPLSSVASGGETSRVSLALKLALSGVTQASTMIFDEIDAGVGGEIANLLADSLERVSKKRQVLIVTHLPQIASRADRHISVFKEVSSGMPVTGVKVLNGREHRVDEVARLLGGGRGARDHAEKMLGDDGGGEV